MRIASLHMTLLTINRQHHLPGEVLQAGYGGAYRRDQPAPVNDALGILPGRTVMKWRYVGASLQSGVAAPGLAGNEAGCSAETLRILDFVSDPANKRHFTKEAARKAFGHIEV